MIELVSRDSLFALGVSDRGNAVWIPKGGRQR